MLVALLPLFLACRSPQKPEKETGWRDTAETDVDTDSDTDVDTDTDADTDTGISGTTVVTVSGRDLLVNGVSFIIKGVGYHPNPIGTSVESYPYGDYFTPEYAEIYGRDIPWLQSLGANTIRLWGWNSDDKGKMLRKEPLNRRSARYLNFMPDADHTDFLNQLHLW